MRKGQIVKCISVNDVESNLTEGKSYIITAGEGDVSPLGGHIIPTEMGFTVTNDDGSVVYALYPVCAHADESSYHD